MKFFTWLLLLISITLMPMLSAQEWEKCQLPPSIASAVATVKENQYPDANTILLWDDGKVKYNVDGTYVENNRWALKICTEAGLKKQRVNSFRYNRFYSKLSISVCRVYRRSGDAWQCRDVDLAKNSREEADTSMLKSNICEPDHRVLTISIPDLQIGDIVYFETASETIHPRMAGVWSDIAMFQTSECPIIESRLVVDAPAEKPLKNIRLRNEIIGTFQAEKEEHRGDRVIYRFSAKNVPMLVKEPKMPPVYLSCQRLCLSTLSRWEEVSDWYYNLCLPHLQKVSSEMRDKVKELTANCQSDEEKVRAIFKFVSQQIRYMGLVEESVSPGYEPHDVEMTFAKRYGVCRDKAALLVAMLNLADIKAFPVLFMAGAEKDSEVPDCYFNHAIAAWDKGDRDYVLMDPTDENTADLQPAYNSECSYIVARPGGDTLHLSPVPPAENNICKFDVDAEISPTGLFSGKVSITCKGFYDTVLRGVFSRKTGRERRKLIASLLTRAMPGATLGKVSITPENLQNTQEPFKLVINFSRADSIQENHDVMPLVMPEFGAAFSFMDNVLGDISLGSRRYALRTASPIAWEETLRIKLPDTLDIGALPKNQEIKVDGSWEYRRSVERENSTITRKKFLASRLVTIHPEDYRDFRDFIHACQNDRKSVPVLQYLLPEDDNPNLQKLFPDDAALILQDDRSVEIIDAQTCRSTRRIRKKILNYAGVKKHSEMKIQYNPATTSVSVSGKVILPDGKEKPLSEREINVVDVAGSSKAPRYPGEKLVVVNFPSVAVNAVVEADIHTDSKDLQDLDFYFPLDGNDPGRRSVTVTVPQNLPLKVDTTGNGVKFTTQELGDKIIYRWVHHSSRGAVEEKNQPARMFWAPGAVISNVDYRKFGKELNEYLLKAAAGTGERFNEVCKELKLSGNDPRIDKITRIRDFVSLKIRTAGPSLKKQSYTNISTPETVLCDSYGSSCDNAILIYALLQAAGIKAEFVPVSTYGYNPTALQFLHRIPMCIFTKLLVFIPDEAIYLNDSSHFGRINCVQSQDKIGLSLKNGELVPIRTASNSDNRKERKYTIEFRLDGSAKILVRTLYHGKYYETVNRYLSEKTPEEKKRLFDTYANALAPGGRISGEPEINFKKHPGIVEFGVEVNNFAGFSGEYLIVDLPELNEKDVDLFAGSDFGANRRTPISFDESIENKISYEITIPAGYELISDCLKKQNVQIGMLNIISDASYNRYKIYIRRRLMRYPEIALPSKARQLLFWKNFFNSPEYRRLIFAPEQEQVGK